MTHISLDYLNLMTGGDRELQHTMLGMLVEELREAMRGMQESLAAGDLEEIQRICHKLKATLPFVGNEELESTNKTLELISKSGDGSGLATGLVGRMAALVPPVLKELQEATGQAG